MSIRGIFFLAPIVKIARQGDIPEVGCAMGQILVMNVAPANIPLRAAQAVRHAQLVKPARTKQVHVPRHQTEIAPGTVVPVQTVN